MRRPEILAFRAIERPLVLQLAGVAGPALRRAGALGADYGYDALNLNVGCPSARAQAGGFGACLMAQPEKAAAAFACLAEASSVPVSVKCRLGLDEAEEEASLRRFVSAVHAAGCRHFVVHARKAWLRGLNPQQNRTRPPLNYAAVHRIAAEFPHARFILNGGCQSCMRRAQAGGAWPGHAWARCLARSVCLAVQMRTRWATPKTRTKPTNSRTRARPPSASGISQRRSESGKRACASCAPLARLSAGGRAARAWRADLARLQRGEITCTAHDCVAPDQPCAKPARQSRRWPSPPGPQKQWESAAAQQGNATPPRADRRAWQEQGLQAPAALRSRPGASILSAGGSRTSKARAAHPASLARARASFPAHPSRAGGCAARPGRIKK